MAIDLGPASLSAEARDFLTSPVRYGTLATINRDGSPHQTVIWYLLRGEQIVINSRRGRRWPANLERERRASLAVFEAEDAVTLELALEESYEGDRAQADIAELAQRYDTPEMAEREMARFRTEPRVSFALRPVRVHVHGDPR